MLRLVAVLASFGLLLGVLGVVAEGLADRLARNCGWFAYTPLSQETFRATWTGPLLVALPLGGLILGALVGWGWV
ncbi:MAG: hypothetical protein M3Z25_11045 [Actinomycetota bacterium]|nr:hypothetical protein [Actinomycetota bacterium]